MISARGLPARYPKAAILLALSVLLIVAFGRHARSQSGDTVTLMEYQARLEQLAERVAGAEGASAGGAVEDAAAELAGIEAVELPDGTRMVVTPLVSAGDSQKEALAHIEAILGQLKAGKGENPAGRLAALDRVLSSGALDPGGGLLGWLRRLLGGAASAPATDAANAGFRLIDILFTIVAGLVLVFVLGRIVQAALGSFLKEADVRREGGVEAPVTAAHARRRAADLASAGSYREAVRQLYLATLLSLEDQGLLRSDRSLTNREVLASVGPWEDVQTGLRPVIDTFETVWYGEREPNRETFERYAGQVESATALIAGAAAPISPRAESA